MRKASYLLSPLLLALLLFMLQHDLFSATPTENGLASQPNYIKIYDASHQLRKMFINGGITVYLDKRPYYYNLIKIYNPISERFDYLFSLFTIDYIIPDEKGNFYERGILNQPIYLGFNFNDSGRTTEQRKASGADAYQKIVLENHSTIYSTEKTINAVDFFLDEPMLANLFKSIENAWIRVQGQISRTINGQRYFSKNPILFEYPILPEHVKVFQEIINTKN